MMKRFRRLRQTDSIRKMVREVQLSLDTLIYPLFIIEGTGVRQEIQSMPGQYRLSVDLLADELDHLAGLGIRNLLLFGIPEHKDPLGSGAYQPDGAIQNAIRLIKKLHPEMVIISDVCMCEYTSHGHCGILRDETVDNDATLEYLARIALSHAEAGTDFVAPSDMMDGRISYIRDALDQQQFHYTGIIAYSVKYASAYYGPFRDAAGSAPAFGDRKSYQMDYMRKKEAQTKVLTDMDEGADIVIIKPAIAYLDIIHTLADKITIPLAAYNVSGEYSMIKAAAQAGWLDEKKAVLENMTAIKRAGADIIITYHAKDLAVWLKEGI